MADVYYKIDGNNIYYSNVQEDSSYTLRTYRATVTEGKNVIVLLNRQDGYTTDTFIWPDQADYLFYRATNEYFPNSGSWSTSYCTYMWRAFYECSNLKSLNMHWAVSRVESFQAMFYGCTSLKYADLSSGYVQYKAKTFGELFRGCTSLSYVDLSNFSPSASVIGTAIPAFDMMFYECPNLERIFTKDNTDGAKTYYDVSGGNNMFTNCVKLPNYITGNNGISYAHTGINQYGPGYFSPISGKHIYNSVDVYEKNNDTWVKTIASQKIDNEWVSVETFYCD